MCCSVGCRCCWQTSCRIALPCRCASACVRSWAAAFLSWPGLLSHPYPGQRNPPSAPVLLVLRKKPRSGRCKKPEGCRNRSFASGISSYSRTNPNVHALPTDLSITTFFHVFYRAERLELQQYCTLRLQIVWPPASHDHLLFSLRVDWSLRRGRWRARTFAAFRGTRRGRG